MSLVSGCAYVHVPYTAPLSQRQLPLATIAQYANSQESFGAAQGQQASYNTMQKNPKADYRFFDYVKAPVHALVQPNFRLKLEQEYDHYNLNHVSFQSIADNGQVDKIASAHYFQSKLPFKKKLIIILPLWGSSKYPPNTIAQMVLDRNQGMANVLLIEGETDFIDWQRIQAAQSESEFVDLIQQYMVQRVLTNIVDMRRWLDWAQAQDDIDPQRIGLVGFSISSIVGSALYGVDRRLSSGIFIIGGANPAEILATCYWEAEEMRETITKRLGWSVERYQSVLREVFEPINPAHLGAEVDPKRVLIFDSKIDTCVPETAREALWAGLGRPERFSFLHDHKMSFMSMTPLGLNFMTNRIHEFLDKNL
ncbi:MAG: alpha/beta hydrolase family protein [Burkholderiaceae bacterium]